MNFILFLLLFSLAVPIFNIVNSTAMILGIVLLLLKFKKVKLTNVPTMFFYINLLFY